MRCARSKISRGRGVPPSAIGATRTASRRASNAFGTGHAPIASTSSTAPPPTTRPNALFAVALEHPALAAEHHRSVVDTCARLLLTSYGLRSLEPGDPRSVGKYVGDQRARDACYHQGTVWAWLIAPFIGAHLRVYPDPHTAASYLEPFRDLLESGAIGTIGEIYDGDPPFAARGCFAQAWSVAEALRAWEMIRRASDG